MLPPDDMREPRDMLEEDSDMLEPDTGMLERDTGVIEHISRPPNSKEAYSARRQLSRRNASDGNGKVPWRQLALLRQENQQLRREVEALRAQGGVTAASPADLNGDVHTAADIEAIHRGYQQEIQHYQQHLVELMDERNRQQEEYREMERRYQDLYYNFLASVEEEAHRMVTEAARTITLSPTGGETDPLLQDVVQTLHTHAQQLEDEHVAHTLYIMREAQRKAARLEEEIHRERQQLMEERQRLIAQQQSVREQAARRYQAIHARLRARWLLQLVTTVGGLLLFLLVIQLLGLSLLRVPLSRSLLFAVITPIFLCPVVACLYVYLRQRVRFIYHGAPHKKKTRTLSGHHA